MQPDIKIYNKSKTETEQAICDLLAEEIDKGLPHADNKIWHRHPVWFLDGNPIVGYSKLKAGIRLMFWSGADFGDEKLNPGTGKFKDASVLFNSVDQVEPEKLKHWLVQAKAIQWDYKNLVKRKGNLVKLT